MLSNTLAPYGYYPICMFQCENCGKGKITKGQKELVEEWKSQEKL